MHQHVVWRQPCDFLQAVPVTYFRRWMFAWSARKIVFVPMAIWSLLECFVLVIELGRKTPVRYRKILPNSKTWCSFYNPIKTVFQLSRKDYMSKHTLIQKLYSEHLSFRIFLKRLVLSSAPSFWLSFPNETLNWHSFLLSENQSRRAITLELMM